MATQAVFRLISELCQNSTLLLKLDNFPSSSQTNLKHLCYAIQVYSPNKQSYFRSMCRRLYDSLHLISVYWLHENTLIRWKEGIYLLVVFWTLWFAYSSRYALVGPYCLMVSTLECECSVFYPRFWWVNRDESTTCFGSRRLIKVITNEIRQLSKLSLNMCIHSNIYL